MGKKEILNIIKTRKSIFCIITCLAVVLSSYIYISKTSYTVKVDGQTIGVVKDKEQVNQEIENIKKDLQKKFDKDIKLGKDITFEKIQVANEDLSPIETIKSRLYSSLEFNVNAYEVKVNGDTLLYLESKEAADTLLDTIKNTYIGNRKKEDFKEISFVEKVEVQETETNIGNIKSIEDALNLVAKGGNEIKTYKVQLGESAWTIASKLNMKVEDIAKANPEINIEKLKIDQEINLSVPKSYIHVKTVEFAQYEEKIPYETVFEETSALYSGEKKIQKPGEDGKKKVEVEVAKINGVVESKNILTEEIIQEPIKMIVLKGTKPRPITVASGDLSNPSRGKLSSRFGTRWGRSHTGIDISAPKGTEIKAADGGKVTFAGTKSGYGKIVILSHGDGFETYYAHCDSIKVKVGERVAKGQVIATVGTTGRVTGSNLHFETRKNGKPIDPLKYVSY
ncbi:peptidoglycan DD-metalloendopeptidase family protein [Anaerosolibacter sp.]|uniref:peptidoglycan DD-metalloendopeptidase family protein n=1 Tax=Anaerosolibacter sp. TaxID=1872527 RepID=UPI0039F0834F